MMFSVGGFLRRGSERVRNGGPIVAFKSFQLALGGTLRDGFFIMLKKSTAKS